jgi:DMSO/TMAO reductase YedYZ heme-binding membrane subunit
MIVEMKNTTAQAILWASAILVNALDATNEISWLLLTILAVTSLNLHKKSQSCH